MSKEETGARLEDAREERFRVGKVEVMSTLKDYQTEVIIACDIVTKKELSPETFPYDQILQESGAGELLQRKGWLHEDGTSASGLSMGREGLWTEPGVYQLRYTFTRQSRDH